MNKERLLELTESAVTWLSGLPVCRIVGIISAIGLFIGFVLVLKPSLAIAIQKKFYEKINWRIEPISMQKEIAHTRMMGLFIVIFLLATLYLVFFTDLFCP
jgi:magnesium-transporting ATPase (P-type)